MNDFFGAFFAILFAAALLIGLVALIRFCVKDARRRGKSPLLVSLAAVLFFPWGLIAWLIFRPDQQDSNEKRGFRLEDHRVQ
jgi:hypothetical protein